MTVQEHVKFIRLFHKFRRALGQQLLCRYPRCGSLYWSDIWLKSSSPSACYRQVLGGTGLALGKPVVPQCIWVPLVKLLEFFQTIYRKVVEWFFRPVFAFWIVEPFNQV